MYEVDFFTVFGVVSATWNEDLGEFDYTGPNKGIQAIISALESAPGYYGMTMGDHPSLSEVENAITSIWFKDVPEIVSVAVYFPLQSPEISDPVPKGVIP